ncbi:MAG: hypothetical protein KC978_11770, partial [Candidatus Omnitrophica bacterium]|nr:hypothetical protein [Candidatus Omnitrophota bacterium]
MNFARTLSIPILISIYTLGALGQVVDVNGDNEVGPHEAIAVQEQWKGPATAANDHNHLGQTWTPEGEGRPLRIRGYFPDGGIVFPTSKGGKQIFNSIPYAPLILDNTAFNGSDLLLGGELGIIRAVEEANSSIVLRPNRDVTIFLNEDGTGPSGVFAIRAENGFPYFYVTEDGDMELSRNANIGGDLDVAGMINGMEFTRTKSKGADAGPVYVISGEE